MKYACFILLFFCSCNGEEWMPKENDADALFGIVETGETPRLQIVRWDADASASNNQLTWTWPDGFEDTFVGDGDFFSLQSGRLPAPGDSCSVTWLHHGETATVDVVMPPQLQLHALNRDSISVANPQSIILDWFELGSDYEYIVDLECLEANPIPIEGQTGNFYEFFDGPQVSAALNLPIERFSYYGTHKLVVHALNPALTDVFFYDPSDIRGLLQLGPDNVVNGKGLVVGTTRLEILLEVY
jgi:hypothetical protein